MLCTGCINKNYKLFIAYTGFILKNCKALCQLANHRPVELRLALLPLFDPRPTHPETVTGTAPVSVHLGTIKFVFLSKCILYKVKMTFLNVCLLYILHALENLKCNGFAFCLYILLDIKLLTDVS